MQILSFFMQMQLSNTGKTWSATYKLKMAPPTPITKIKRFFCGKPSKNGWGPVNSLASILTQKSRIIHWQSKLSWGPTARLYWVINRYCDQSSNQWQITRPRWFQQWIAKKMLAYYQKWFLSTVSWLPIKLIMSQKHKQLLHNPRSKDWWSSKHFWFQAYLNFKLLNQAPDKTLSK